MSGDGSRQQQTPATQTSAGNYPGGPSGPTQQFPTGLPGQLPMIGMQLENGFGNQFQQAMGNYMQQLYSPMTMPSYRQPPPSDPSTSDPTQRQPTTPTTQPRAPIGPTFTPDGRMTINWGTGMQPGLEGNGMQQKQDAFRQVQMDNQRQYGSPYPGGFAGQPAGMPGMGKPGVGDPAGPPLTGDPTTWGRQPPPYEPPVGPPLPGDPTAWGRNPPPYEPPVGPPLPGDPTMWNNALRYAPKRR